MHGNYRDTHMNLAQNTVPRAALAGAALGRSLRGRRRECEALDRLVANVRAGQSRVLVLRGEAGAGKTALLEYLVRRAAGCRVTRAAGAEPEMEMAFAGLHQLCAPFLDRLGRLPGPQRDALGTAFSLRDGDAPDRFAVGLAALSLVSEVARERPLICVVDDAQWLDRASARALAFVARHLAAAPVALVFATCHPDGEQDLTGLPEAQVGGLADGDARALLDSVVIGPLDERVRDRIVAETRGNPQALLELPRRLIPGELAGGFGLPGAVAPLTGRLEEGFLRRFELLPEPTRLLLVAAAAEPTGDPVVLWGAAGQLGVEAERPGHRRPPPGSSSSAGRCGSAIRWPGPRSTGRRRCGSASASTAPSRTRPTRPPTPIAAPGTSRTRHRDLMRASLPSLNAQRAGPGPAAA